MPHTNRAKVVANNRMQQISPSALWIVGLVLAIGGGAIMTGLSMVAHNAPTAGTIVICSVVLIWVATFTVARRNLGRH